MSVGLFAFVAFIVTFAICYNIIQNKVVDDIRNNNNKED